MYVYLDTETCGLHSMPVLFQFAYDDGDVHLYDVWEEPIGKTLELIESWLDKTVVMFNASFDWFQIVKTYNVFRLCPHDWIPQEHIEDIAAKELEARDGPSVKPKGVLDLMLHSRKGPYQALMGRKDIVIRKVPTPLAYALARELEKRVEVDSIFFAKRAHQDAPKWQVVDRHRDGALDTEFKDVALRFAPAAGLKFLAEYAMGMKPKYHYDDVEPPKEWYPIEYGYAPFAASVSADENWEVREDGEVVGYAWPGVIERFIEHWGGNEHAREYARDDIVYTRALHKHFDFPEPNDDDSVLACMVPIVRWRGFKIDIPGIQRLLEKAQAKIAASPVNTNSTNAVRGYLAEVMDDMEQVAIDTSTDKATLESIIRWNIDEDEECTKCGGSGCPRCDNGWLRAGREPCKEDGGNHPAAYRAKELMDVKIAAKEVNLYEKLLRAGRFHADFVVVGTKSTRMSGTSGLNAQGIKGSKEVRRCFPLAQEGYQLCGGDFDSFEVTLADAVYNDPALREQLTSKITCPFCEGQECEECDNGEVRVKIHGLFGQSLYPGHSYAEVLASSGTDHDMYLAGKSGVFAMIYGGNADTLVRNLGIEPEAAKEAFEDFSKRFPVVGKAREKTFDEFCSMRQPHGIGTQIIWHEPKDYVESFLGFRRYFTLENMICKAIFDLAQKPPREWRQVKIPVWRRDRVQTAAGAVSSALYGAAFALQQANMRAACNHEIQSPGGQITKAVQRAIWDLQPAGVHPLQVAPMNVHDEIMCVTAPSKVNAVTGAVNSTVCHYRKQVPLLGMTWFEEMANWAEKKGGAVAVKMRAPEMA